MPFLLSTNGQRKKKSYIHNDKEESAMRREMVKQKLYAEHMIDDDDDTDAYLQLRLAPASPESQKGQHHHLPHRHKNRRSSKTSVERMAQQSRRIATPNYIDHSGSLAHRKPVRRAHSESTARQRGTTPPLPAKRARSAQRIHQKGSDDPAMPAPAQNGVANARFPPSTGTRASRPAQKQVRKILLSPSPRDSPRTYDHYNEGEFHSDENDEDNEDGIDEFATDVSDDVPSPPLPPQRPPPRRRRATVATQSLQKSADAAMRFGPPRKIKSYYPGANKPRNSNFHMTTMPINRNESLDMSDRSSTSKGEKGGFRRGGLFRRVSGNSDDSGDTASSSDRSSSFFRAVRRANSGSTKRPLKPSLKRSNKSAALLLSSLTSQSDHSTGSQSSWYTSGGNSRNSAPPEIPSQRQKNEVYQSALKRAKERQAMKQNRNHFTLTDQLSKLPRSKDGSDDAEYDLIVEDDGKEGKSLFSNLISKIEDIYEDCY